MKQLTPRPSWTREDVHSLTRERLDGWESTQWIRVPDARVPEGERLARFLREIDRAYSSWIEKFTGGIVKIYPGAHGGKAAAIQPCAWPVGLKLSPAELRLEQREIVRRIASGWLVAERSGELGQGIVPVDGGAIAYVRLSGFRPRLAAFGALGEWVYARTQSVIHRRLSRAFLRVDFGPRLLALE